MIGDRHTRRLREWLTCNKVFFETLSATLLSFMAVIVGGAQWCQSSQQSKLAALQLELARQGARPRFVLQRHLEKEDGIRFTHDVLTIDNLGRPADGFEEEEAVFVNLHCSGPRPVDFSLPIVGYFVGHGLTGATTGRLLMTNAQGNWDRVGLLEREAHEALTANDRFCTVSIAVYVEVSTQDGPESRNHKYFVLNLIDGQAELAEDAGEGVFRRYRDGGAEDFWRLTSARLIERAGIKTPAIAPKPE